MTGQNYIASIDKNGGRLLYPTTYQPSEALIVRVIVNYLIESKICESFHLDVTQPEQLDTNMKNVFGLDYQEMLAARLAGEVDCRKLIRENVTTIKSLYSLTSMIKRDLDPNYPTYWINITLPDTRRTCIGWCGFEGFAELRVGDQAAPLPNRPRDIMYTTHPGC
jgi:hypothetical protein